MFLLYSFLFTLAFILILPLLLLRREKYAAGFKQRLGILPEFRHDGRPVLWLHCVSVGETYAARPLIDALRAEFPEQRLVVSTTTRTGQMLAANIFRGDADAVFYFPFDWKFSVERALRNYQPSTVLLMETEIWPRFFSQSHAAGAKIAIVNGRLSEKSFHRYSRVSRFIKKVLSDVDAALMQTDEDATRIIALGIDPQKVAVTGNLKFDHSRNAEEDRLTDRFRERFGIDGKRPLLVAASTHEPEEKWVLDALEGVNGYDCRLLIAPRHPERFDNVARLLAESRNRFVRRSDQPSERDKEADVILLDSIGELRSVYPLADIVFVGGSLIPHGGQSVLEPAAVGKAIVTGPHTKNFSSAIKKFLEADAILQTPEQSQEFQISERLYEMFIELLNDAQKRRELGENAASVMGVSNRGATLRTIEALRPLLDRRDQVLGQ